MLFEKIAATGTMGVVYGLLVFVVILIIVFGLPFMYCVYIAPKQRLTRRQRILFDACLTCWQAIVRAIAEYLGRK